MPKTIRPWWQWWEENLGEKFNFELDKRQKGLRIFEQFKSGSFGYLLGKFKILEELQREFIITIQYRFPSFKIWLAYLMYKGWLLYPFRKPQTYISSWIYEIDGHKLLMDKKDFRMREILKDYTYLDIWEPETTKLIKKYVKSGDICLDVGASIGYFTLLFARQVGNRGKVIAFEPTEMNFNYLCENIKLNGFQDIVLPVRLAAYDRHEVIKAPLNNLYAEWLNAVAVDDYLVWRGIEKVDFIKMDVDGPEPRVLQGLVRTFEKNPQLKMVIEYYPKYIKGAGCDPQQFMDILNKYFTYTVIPDDYEGECVNYFAIRK